jgi:hypothetical protein
MELDVWIDPACPWCWLTSRWIEDVAPERDLQVRWRPISLKFKNDVQPDSPFFEATTFTLGLLRIMERLRAEGAEDRLGELYTAVGTRIHQQGQQQFDPADALAEVGLDPSLAAAAADDSWDEVIRAHMADGLALTGDDVGTPLLGFENRNGRRVGFFGPVVSRRLPLDEALVLWDGFLAVAATDAFWELKRTRTERPDPTPLDAPR